MLCKLHAETMEWTFVHPRDEALNRLVREELKPAKTLLQFWGWVDRHAMDSIKQKTVLT